MPNFRANGSAVAEKNGNGQTNKQTNKQTNTEKYNIGKLAVKPVKNGARPLHTARPHVLSKLV